MISAHLALIGGFRSLLDPSLNLSCFLFTYLRHRLLLGIRTRLGELTPTTRYYVRRAAVDTDFIVGRGVAIPRYVAWMGPVHLASSRWSSEPIRRCNSRSAASMRFQVIEAML